MNFVDGEILYIDKPLGWTSFDAVKYLRTALTRRLGVKKLKVGHAGTLDPLATGVMIVATGKATRRIEQLQAGVKEYVATVALGATTPSFDRETPIDEYFPTEHLTEEAVRNVLTSFHGTIEQIPPEYSAIKIDGQRAYHLARKGREANLKPKVLVIDAIELLDFTPAGQPEPDASEETLESRLVNRHTHTDHPLAFARIRVVCSKGTYIRALARDIGRALGTGAHLAALRRTRVGDADIVHCKSLTQTADMIATCPVEMPVQD